jgi:hypothetical protein
MFSMDVIFSLSPWVASIPDCVKGGHKCVYLG